MGRIRSLQVCSRCRNHNVKSILKGHKKNCEFKKCQCSKCLVTKDRQSFIAKEIAMHRYEVKRKEHVSDEKVGGLKMNFVRCDNSELPVAEKTQEIKIRTKRLRATSEVRMDQRCSRCRNHGVFQFLRGHKNKCPYVNCLCSKCEITKMRREVMAKQIKDYRNVKMQKDTPARLTAVFENISSDDEKTESFVSYEPLEDRDLFFMIQSLYEKYGNQNTEKRIQFIYAFAQLAKRNWDQIETSLAEGKTSRTRNINLALLKIVFE